MVFYSILFIVVSILEGGRNIGMNEFLTNFCKVLIFIEYDSNRDLNQ